MLTMSTSLTERDTRVLLRLLSLQHDVISDKQKAYLPGNLTTLPQLLKAHGYATHAVGKYVIKHTSLLDEKERTSLH